jgi:hypothetical protein
MTAQTHEDVWQYTENAPTNAQDVSDLWHWSTNYDAGRGPFTLFLDLIGWSDDNYGEKFYNMNDMSLGYVELDKLARALGQYALNPRDVERWVDGLMAYDEA